MLQLEINGNLPTAALQVHFQQQQIDLSSS